MSLTNNSIVFRKLLVSDYNTNYLNLMNQLSTIDKENTLVFASNCSKLNR